MTDELFNLLRQDMKEGFLGINERLDAINGRTRENEQNIAVLKDRESRESRKSLILGGGSGAAVIGIIEALKAFVWK